MSITVYILLFIQKAIDKLKPLYDRFVVRDHLISGKIKETFAREDGSLPMSVWFNIEFWKALTPIQGFFLVTLASFKVFTFPLGVAIGSYSLIATYPYSNFLFNIFMLILHPFFLFVANKGLNEFVFNEKTILGFSIVMISLVIGAVGWYLVWTGGQ